MYQIEELPDLKVAWHESYKCLAEPLLEYVTIAKSKNSRPKNKMCH